MSEPALDARSQREQAFFADWSLNPAGDALRWERERALLQKARPGGLGSVLSLGCGRGQFETRLAASAERVLGIDLSPESIADAQAHAREAGCDNVRFACEDVASFAFEERFDTIVCVGFLHHLDAAGSLALLERIYSHLRPGGLLHTQDPNVHGVLRAVGRVVLGERYHQFHSPDERELDPAEVRDQVLQAGFAKADIHYMDLALIPGMQLWPAAPPWTMRALAGFDRAFCATPFRRAASGFSIHAER